MKKVLIITAMVFCSLSIFAQGFVNENTELKAGMYKSFGEIKLNKPSIEFDYTVIAETLKHKIPSSNKKLVLYNINIDKKEASAIGNIFGFCDGKHMYIDMDYPRLKSKTRFSRVEILGPYFYSADISKSHTGGQFGGSVAIVTEKLIHIKTGKTLGFTKGNMRRLLANYPDLLKAFKKEPKFNNSKFMEYYLKFVEVYKKK